MGKMMTVPTVEPEINWKACGPYAVATALGVSYKVARGFINRARGKPASTHIFRMSNDMMTIVLARYTHRPMMRHYNGEISLARWIDSRDPETRSRVVVVALSTHFVVVQGTRFIDNNVGDVNVTKCPHRRARVNMVWVLE